MLATRRLYWDDDHCLQAQATVVALQENSVAFDQTCFYPGGGGQPHDTGTISFADGSVHEIHSVNADAEGVIWHVSSSPLPQVSGSMASLLVNQARRVALAKYHTVLHVLNTIALRDYKAWITGVQISEVYSRIDFKMENFSPEICKELEQKVSAVIQENHELKSFYLPEEEFRNRQDLLRTLQVQPPVINGKVRVVEIAGFDAQACGGTHLANTSEIGTFTIYKTENKGKINKRLYIRLS